LTGGSDFELATGAGSGLAVSGFDLEGEGDGFVEAVGLGGAAFTEAGFDGADLGRVGCFAPAFADAGDCLVGLGADLERGLATFFAGAFGLEGVAFLGGEGFFTALRGADFFEGFTGAFLTGAFLAGAFGAVFLAAAPLAVAFAF